MTAAIPFRLVRRAHVDALQRQVSGQKAIISNATDFVKEIESGNFDVRYGHHEGEAIDDMLGASLESMRDKLKSFAIEEKQRHWVTEGIARFVDILRSGQDISKLADEIISNLVRYLDANQGALLMLNDDNRDDIFLEMIGCYAYNRKKFLHHRINPGEGMTGQVFLEKSTLYMTHIPENYVRITSGLGEALPRNLLIVPLKINEDVFGIVELASFKTIKPYQIHFVETIAESIASTISTVRNMARTQKLLEETQVQSEQMRAVEEEMRQNMEELEATQEEMRRAQHQTEAALREISEKEAYMITMLNASVDGILTVDNDLKIVLANKVIRDTFGAQGFEITSGFHISKLSPEGEEEAFIFPYRKALTGEVFEVEKNYFGHDYIITYNPIRDTENNIIGVSVFTKDVSEQAKLRRQNEKIHAAEKLRMSAVENYRNVLRELVKSSDIQNGNLNGALEEITVQLSSALGVSRASIWAYNHSNDSIVLEKQFLAQDKSFVSGAELFAKDLPHYFEAVKSEQVIIAADAMDHPALVEFRKGYLDVYDIRSMLDVPFFLDGKIGGVICCENQKEWKDWTAEDADFAKSVADLITVAYKSHTARTLLQEAQTMTETLRAQEEELRQNMEELSATQEELERQMNSIQRMKNDLEIREQVFGLTTILSESDTFGTITLVNDKLCLVSGYSREELIGKPHNVFRHPDMPRELFARFWDTIKKGNTFQGIIKNKCKDGSHYWVDATIMPVKDSEGKIVKYVGARYHIKDDEFALAMYNEQAKTLGLSPLQKQSATVR